MAQKNTFALIGKRRRIIMAPVVTYVLNPEISAALTKPDTKIRRQTSFP